jgi:hypothetical protein
MREVLPVVRRRIQVADRIPHGSSSVQLELSHPRLLISMRHRSCYQLMSAILGLQLTAIRLVGLTGSALSTLALTLLTVSGACAAR